MVHGGLRYLQNLDLGLVREALLERQLMVQLAPHLVYPTPFLVPSFGEERRDRKIGLGLNMYDVMATTRVGRGRREMRSSKEEDEDFYWSPDRHRTIDREELLEMVPVARAPRPQRRLPLLRLPDRRRPPRPHDPRRGRAVRRGDAERGRGDRADLGEGEGARASPSSRPIRASGSRSPPTTSSTRPGSGPTCCAPRRWSRRRTCRGSSRAAAPTCCSTGADLSTGSAACIVPAGEGRAIFALPWYGRTLVGTTDNDFEGDIDHPAARATTKSSTCSTRSTRSSAPRSAARTWSAPTPGSGP